MIKSPPFDSLRGLIRVLTKALLLAVVINVLLLWTGFNPVREITQVNLWGGFGGRARLVYPSDLANGQLHVEAQLATHEVTIRPKAADEYRVVLLGESGIAGWGLPDEETLSTQLTELGIEIDGRRVRAYNLAYPQPSVARDVIVLDAILDEGIQPDLVLWFVTAASLDNSNELEGANRVFFNINEARLQDAIDTNPELIPWFGQKSSILLDEPDPIDAYWGIRDQELIPIWLNSLLYPLVPPDLAETDVRIGLADVPANVRYPEDHPGFLGMPNQTWTFLSVGCRMAVTEGVQMLLVNRPILISEQGAFSQTYYNSLYEKTLYDRYRTTLNQYTMEQGIAYADFWNIVPPENYTDTPLHADATGYGILAAELQTVLEAGGAASTCQ